MEKPEKGTINTPWGAISWGLTNNKADIIKIIIAVVALIAIVYLLRKK
jgi:hypothetical protein